MSDVSAEMEEELQHLEYRKHGALKKKKKNPGSGSYQGDVIENEAEGGRSLSQIFTDLPGHQLSLSDQFSCIEPGLDTHTHRLTLHINVIHVGISL